MHTDNNNSNNNDAGKNPAGNEPIRFLGREPARKIAMLQCFHQMGLAFAEGARSLREINAKLEQQSFRDQYPDDLPYGTSTLSRCGRAAEKYFGEHFGLEGKAHLFESAGKGYPISGMTELGRQAWAIAREFLVKYGVIDPDE